MRRVDWLIVSSATAALVAYLVAGYAAREALRRA